MCKLGDVVWLVVCSVCFFFIGLCFGIRVCENEYADRLDRVEERLDYMSEGFSDVTDMTIEMWNFLGGK